MATSSHPQRYPFDLLHIHDLYLLGGGLAAGRQLRLPVVADLHENWVDALTQYAWSTRYPGKLFISIPRWCKLEKLWLDRVDRIITVVEEGCQRLARLGIATSKMTAVPNTIKFQDFDNHELNSSVIAGTRSEFSIVYTGTIELHRGLDVLIKALPIVLAVGPAKLIIVGEGRIRPELEGLAESVGVAEHVSFEGWQLQP